MMAVRDAGIAEIALVSDPSDAQCAAALSDVRGAWRADSFDAMLDAGLDGLVIATPSALHADQAVRALDRGLAVFCQKPLARTAPEARRVVDAARAADRLLGVDLSYRFVNGVPQVRRLVRSGSLGRIFAVDLVFHNAYGPDKAWFYDAALSGGGCVMDLGVHLVDLALWILDGDAVDAVTSRLFAAGRPLPSDGPGVEDYAEARLDLRSGAVVRLSCSWRLHAGTDAVIEASFYGTDGGARIRNAGGSFFDFVVEQAHGTGRETLATPPDAWGGRAVVDWARRLAAGSGFESDIERAVDIARVLDRIYGR
jgi:predicted dehydrogenase